MHPKQLAILDGIDTKSGILLNEYLTAKRQYDFIMFSNKGEHVFRRFDNSYGAHLFHLINGTFIEDLIKRLVNVVLDGTRGSVSIVNLIKSVETHKELFENKASEIVSVNVDFGDNFPEDYKEEFKREMAEQDAKERLERFHQQYGELATSLVDFQKHESTEKWEKIRHKVVSHIDAKSRDGKVKRTNLSEFGIKYSDLTELVEKVQHLVELTRLTCASASYAYDMYEEMNIEYSKDYWDRCRVGMRFRGGIKMNARKRKGVIRRLHEYYK